MPNAKTRMRRRKAGKPTYFSSVVSHYVDEHDEDQEEELILTCMLKATECKSRFLVLGNCPRHALMSWLGAHLTQNDHGCGFRCAWRLIPDDFSVWIFASVDDAKRAAQRFHDVNKTLPCYVPKNMFNLTLYQVHGQPVSLKRFK